MSRNYTLKYRTFDQLLADVRSSFKKFDLKDLIDPQEMIKVTKKVNYDLGLRINQTKEAVLEVEKGRVRLPNNFHSLNFAFMCGKFEVKEALPQGTHLEERVIDPVQPEYQNAPKPINLQDCDDTEEPQEIDPCDPCLQCGNPCCDDTCPTCSDTAVSCSLNCKGEKIEVVQVTKMHTRVYEHMIPLRVKQSKEILVDCDCPNLFWQAPNEITIDDNWIYANFDKGHIYINYESLMENEEGDILVLDHDLINEYYEYALKRRVIENMIMDGINVNQAQITLIESRYKESRTNSLSIVNTPNFEELREVWKANRKAMYHKYFNMFSSVHHPGGVNPFAVIYNRRY